MSQVSGIKIDYSNQVASKTDALDSAQGTSKNNFSEVLTETIKNQLLEEAVTLSSPAGSGNSALSGLENGGTLESLILGAAASGEASDVEMALFMLCLMMEENQDSEMAPLLSAMASLLAGISGDSEAVRSNFLASDYSAYTKDTVDKSVFNTSSASLPDEAWKAANPQLTGTVANRSADRLREIIDQFNVESAERYRPYRYGGDTYCNIFVWDVTKALGAEIPHYVDAATGTPRTYPDIKGAKELTASATYDWLLTRGKEYGWKEVSPKEAQAYANLGKPAVTAWKNTGGGASHVQVVCPSENGAYDSIRGVTVAQAGSQRDSYTHISSTFSSSKLKDVRYFVHE